MITPGPLPEEQARRILGDLVSEACQRFAAEITEIVIQYLRLQGVLPEREGSRVAEATTRLRRSGREVRRDR